MLRRQSHAIMRATCFAVLSVALVLAVPAAHAQTVGYYDTFAGSGVAAQVPPITAAMFIPMLRTNVAATDLAGILERLGTDGKVLLVDRRDNDNLTLAARNNPRLKTVDALAVNVYDVVDRPWMVVSEAALGRLLEVLEA